MCLKALLKVRGDAYITLGGNGKALEKINVFHRFALENCCIPTYRGEKKVACHPKLWGPSRAKGGGGSRTRTYDLLHVRDQDNDSDDESK